MGQELVNVIRKFNFEDKVCLVCSAGERNKNDYFFSSLVGLSVTTSLLMTWQLGMFVKS